MKSPDNIISNNKNLPIYIYFHICTINNYLEVIKNIYSKIVDSGLIDKIEELRISILGEQNKIAEVSKIISTEKAIIIFTSSDVKLYERPILNQLWEDANKEDFKALYLHSKGVSKRFGRQSYIKEWVEYLVYFNIELHQKCLDFLDKYDTCGVNLRPHFQWHYSGNFWWANSTYIRKLEKGIKPGYFNPEMWLCNNRYKKEEDVPSARFVSLWNSKICHYTRSYPENMYTNKDIKILVITRQ